MRHFRSQIKEFLILHETLKFEKFNSADFKYWNSSNNKYFVPKHKLFWFHLNFFHYDKFESVYSNMTTFFFKILLKYPNEVFSAPDLKFLNFT